jgi:hypothetical protein
VDANELVVKQDILKKGARSRMRRAESENSKAEILTR